MQNSRDSRITFILCLIGLVDLEVCVSFINDLLNHQKNYVYLRLNIDSNVEPSYSLVIEIRRVVKIIVLTGCAGCYHI